MPAATPKPKNSPIPPSGFSQLLAIYHCFCDETRLRILNLLVHAGHQGKEGPLCVCHFQDLLDRPQVHVSKHLHYLRKRGMVEAKKRANYMIYSLPAQRSPELDGNLRCLQDCTQSHPIFKADLKRLAALRPKIEWIEQIRRLPDSAVCTPKNEVVEKP